MYRLPMSQNPRATKRIVSRGILRGHELVVVDVGCSGGLPDFWQVFGDQLKAYAFDPLVNECERLQKIAPANTRYFAAWVTDGGHPGIREAAEFNKNPKLANDNSISRRTSTTEYMEKHQEFSLTREFNGNNAEIVHSKDYYSLDEWSIKNGISEVDFIKIDTDGADFGVVLGAERLIRNSTLGTRIECNFPGGIHPYANTFSNMDIHLRSRGFSLYDLDYYPYSRAALPRQFCHPFPAQTFGGQVVWGDGLFFRDVAREGYQENFDFKIDPYRLIKLVCLLEVYGYADCAAEILVNFREQLSSIVNVDELLNDLTPMLHGCALSYKEYLHRFANTPELFFPIDANARAKGLEHVELPASQVVPPRDDVDAIAFSLFPNYVSQGHVSSSLALLGQQVDLRELPSACADLRKLVGDFVRTARSPEAARLSESNWMLDRIAAVRPSLLHVVGLSAAISKLGAEQGDLVAFLEQLRNLTVTAIASTAPNSALAATL